MKPKYGFMFAGVLLILSLTSQSGIRYLFKIHYGIKKAEKEIVVRLSNSG